MAGDPLFSNVVSLLSFEGDDGATDIVDGTGRAITAYGNAQIDTSWSASGGSSCYFDGNASYLYAAPSQDFTFGTGPFTIEGAYLIPSAPTATEILVGNISGDNDNEWRVVISSNGLLRLVTWNLPVVDFDFVVPNTLTRWAVSFDGTTYRAFLNGILQNTGTTIRNFSSTAGLNVGRNNRVDAPQYYLGWQDDIRITKGLCRYTENYTPLTGPFPNYHAQVAIQLTESIAAELFNCSVVRVSDGQIVNVAEISAQTTDVPVQTLDAVYLLVAAKIGSQWKSGESVTLNELRFPTAMGTKPYYFKALNAGTTGASEPIWPTTPGGQVTDNGITWELVERMVQPQAHGPFMPA